MTTAVEFVFDDDGWLMLSSVRHSSTVTIAVLVVRLSQDTPRNRNDEPVEDPPEEPPPPPPLPDLKPREEVSPAPSTPSPPPPPPLEPTPTRGLL